MDKEERAMKRAVVREQLSLSNSTRLKEGDLEFLYRLVNMYDDRFRDKKFVWERQLSRPDEEEKRVEYKCLTFGKYSIKIHEEHKIVENGQDSLVYTDEVHLSAKEVLACFKMYVNNGWFRDMEDLTETLVFGPEYRW